jgi:hypothetical protein
LLVLPAQAVKEWLQVILAEHGDCRDQRFKEGFLPIEGPQAMLEA